jgi:hypothetical protein
LAVKDNVLLGGQNHRTIDILAYTDSGLLSKMDRWSWIEGDRGISAVVVGMRPTAHGGGEDESYLRDVAIILISTYAYQADYRAVFIS